MASTAILPNLSAAQWGALDSSVATGGPPGTITPGGNYIPLPTGSPAITGTPASTTGISGIAGNVLSNVSAALGGIGASMQPQTPVTTAGASDTPDLTKNAPLASDALILRIGFFLAGLVLLAGAVYTYKH